MKAISRTITLIILILAVGLSSQAQQPPAELSVRIAETDVSDFPRAALTVTVRDANGVPVPDLDADAFEVNEDRVPEARPITAVEPVINPELPVGLVLVVDISGSMAGQPLADAQEAARTLVEQLGEEDEVAFIAFADTVDLDGLDPAREHPPTTDRKVVKALIDGLEAQGGTPLYDALYKGAQWAQEGTLGHRAVILLTDGVDEDPGSAVASAETPIQEATRANVPVFTIGLGTQIDAGYLERVARTTGGTYQETPDSAQLTTLFLNVLERLKQQYQITYESGLPGDEETHRVMVTTEVGDRQASDEAGLGALPLLESTPTAEISNTPTTAPEPTPTIVVSAEPEEAETGSMVLVTVAAGGLGLLAMLVIGVIALSRRQQASDQEYCTGCGRALAPGEVCPDCGPDAGRFTRPPGT